MRFQVLEMNACGSDTDCGDVGIDFLELCWRLMLRVFVLAVSVRIGGKRHLRCLS